MERTKKAAICQIDDAIENIDAYMFILHDVYLANNIEYKLSEFHQKLPELLLEYFNRKKIQFEKRFKSWKAIKLNLIENFAHFIHIKFLHKIEFKRNFLLFVLHYMTNIL